MSPTESDADPTRWATTVVLGDGATAYIRPLTVDDKDALLAFHERQSKDSVYRRFFSPKPTLSSRELEHFTNVDMVDRVALAVEVHDELVAWSSYERWTGRDEAEAAFMVDDAHQGRGIATLMLEHLAAIARANGIDRFTAEVLSDNRGMLAVFSKAGWPLQRKFDSGVVDLDWELATTDDYLDTVEGREQRADSRAVARLLLPRAIAVVGASDRADSVGHLLWNHVRSSTKVPVYPVNPRLDDLDGRRCYGSVADVPDDVSLAIIAVPTRHLEQTIDQCIAKRMRGAVIVTTVEDHDGTPVFDLDVVVARARRNGLRIIGPSSMGIASTQPDSALQAAIVDVTLPPGGTAISMQSGTLGVSLLRRARDLQLGINWFVSLGDKSDVSANDLLQFWEEDQHTTVIGLYTESIGNPRKFARIARRVSRSRPIVAVRTGAAAGDLASALYLQAGLIEVPTVPAMLDACRVLATQPVLHGERIAVITNSSSPGILSRAALESSGLTAVVDGRRLDWSAGPEEYTEAINEALERDDVDGVLVLFAPPLPQYEAAMGPTITLAAEGATKPVVAVMIGSGDGPVSPDSPVPSFSFPEQAVAALARSFAYGRWLDNEAQAEPATARAIDPRRASELINEHLDGVDRGTRVHLDVEGSIELLSTYGIPVASASTSTPGEAATAAAAIGYPVAIKASGRQRGRSAQSGVALDLTDDDSVEAAVATMVEALGDGAERLVVQQMIPPGVDLRLRCRHDDRLGVVVEIGYGGADAELIDDRTSRLAPVSPASAAAMLTETKAGRAITDAELDRSPLVDMIVQAAQLCAAHVDIDELDLNPVILSSAGAIATDVDVTLLDRPDEEPALRRLG